MSILANKFVENREIVIVTMAKTDSFYPFFNRIKTLAKIFQDEKPDIIISFMIYTNILSTVAAKMARKKIIISERIAYDYYGSKILNIIRRFIYLLSDAFVTQTFADMKNYNFLKKAYVIYNPIEIKNRNTNTKKQNIILGVGRLDKQKGFDVLIKVFNEIQKNNWKLVIAGDGDERKNLEKLIKNLQATNIELVGKKKDIFKWYEKASIFVLSSKKEGFPNVLIEAMSMGCAVVSFDCPYGPAEIIEDGVNGILVENQNQEKLKQAIEKLMSEENLRDRLSKEAIEVKEKYSLDKIVKEWENIIQGIIDV